MAKVIRDAVHGDIDVADEELRLLDTPELQRLRGIKQLGTASLVYPSAVHTRFEHSLGTLHLARRIIAHLPAGTLAPVEQRAVRLAALLHDVTHIPYGHTFEDERRIFARHDAPGRTRRVLARGRLGRALAATGLEAEVVELLAGEPERPLLADIVRGTVGADLLDYLRRDSLFCGFAQSYDERLFRYLVPARDAGGRERLALRVSKGGLLRADALSEVLHLLRLRYTLNERVYFHHGKVAAGAAISRAVELAVNAGLTLEALFDLGDAGLLAHLRSRFADVPGLVRILERVEARRLYKRAYVLSRAVGERAQAELIARYHEDRPAREAAEAAIAGQAGLEPDEVILYCPGQRMAAKEADIPVVVRDGAPTASLADLALPEVDGIVERHRDLWRFFVFLARERAEHLGTVSRACERLFGHRNLLDTLVRAPGLSPTG